MSNVTGKIIALGGGGGASEAEVEELRSAITELEGEVEGISSDIGGYVSDWLDEHPEATTTVEDGSITRAKLATDTLNITGLERISMTANKYISLSGASVEMYQGNPVLTGDSASYSVGYVACSAGDVFDVSGTGGASTRLWGFINSTGTILARSKESDSGDNIILVAPENAAFIIVHTSDGKYSYKGESLKPVQNLLTHEYMDVGNIVQGSISNSTGLVIESTTRVCCGDFIPWEENMLLMVNGGLKFSLRYYAANGNFLGGDNAWTDGCGYVGKFYNTAPGYVKAIFAFRNDGAITPATVGSVTILRSSVSPVDKTMTKEGKAADAKTVGSLIEGAYGKVSSSQTIVGNMTVRAAKTINFTDGTPPMVDWYLLQSVDNKFYMSKDLVSRRYLFTTVGSGMSGYVANWSVGITPNNDVLFVADAAGLDTTTHGRLSDDNRINPVVFLASENYEKPHFIDFGSSLKPCGWLGNVGYCILPNGNIAFCEYTRGTVKTANVWLISGDITDPSNWSVKWSTNIIDTLDSTTPGVKHCHEMMYDFYTGVLYFGTGDSESGSLNYYSTDGGANWTSLCDASKKKCRRLNFIFMADKVYWAADSFEAENRYFFIAERDGNGVIDIDNATEVSLTSGNGQSCYGCVYMQDKGLIVLMDRQDSPQSLNYMNWYCYDLSDQTIHLIGKIYSPNEYSSYLGFRCEYIDYYPTGNVIVTGFNPRQADGGSDINRNGLCGNNSGGDGDGSTRINNLLMYVYKTGSSYSYRAKTLI